MTKSVLDQHAFLRRLYISIAKSASLMSGVARISGGLRILGSIRNMVAEVVEGWRSAQWMRNAQQTCEARNSDAMLSA